MPRGASPKREREYRELVGEFEEEGRYKGREEEVASRIVNKQRAQLGETEAAHAADRAERSPDEHLPIKNYDHLKVDEIISKLRSLSPKDVDQIRSYEQGHRHRKTLLEEIDRHRRAGERRAA
ncbi:MAG: hypothetical protein ACRDI2_16440 [Chloroflexota bacterium]